MWYPHLFLNMEGFNSINQNKKVYVIYSNGAFASYFNTESIRQK
jgi:hypothetical protein